MTPIAIVDNLFEKFLQRGSSHEMGITGGLVKSVFSKNKATATHEGNIKSNSIERRRWNSVRSYLCGDEFNSVLAEEDSESFKSSEASATVFSSVFAEQDSASVKVSEASITQLDSVLEDNDSASVKSSEATVTQPLPKEANTESLQGEETKENEQVQNAVSAFEIMHHEQAAIIIQSAFRDFRARCQSEGSRLKGCEKDLIGETKSLSGESLGTSIQVQMGNSIDIFSVQDERTAVSCRSEQKVRSQGLRLKEDWDDSTVSSNISKLRIQNRLEASTRRERALAYAFSQQLRICPKKRGIKLNAREPNMGWSWLERWMATRLPESSSVESHTSKQVEPIYRNQKLTTSKSIFDVAWEEKESCGSNEVSLAFDALSIKATQNKISFKPTKTRKVTTSISKRKTVPSHQCPKDNRSRVIKKDPSRQAVKEVKGHQAK